MDKNTLYAYINEIGNHLSEKRQFGSASLMIGAGFSKNAKRINGSGPLPPDWRELAYKMFDELYPNNQDSEKRIQECSGKNVLSLAQKYKVIFGRQKLNKLIEQSVSDDYFEPTELYEDLLRLDWEDIYTTNYDTLLEKTLHKLNLKREYQIIYSCNDLPQSTRPRLIKLHGSVDKSNNYIITEEDYRTYPVKYAPFVNTVQQSMIETQLCLIGFSGTDPNFLNWLGWLRDNMGDNCPKIFLCGYFPNMEYADLKMLEDKNIIVLDLSLLLDEEDEKSHYKALEKFVDILKKRIKKKGEPIFSEKNLKFRAFPTENFDRSEYKKEVLKTVSNLENKVEEFVTLPLSDSKNIGAYCTEHLQGMLLDGELQDETEIISKLSYVIYICNYPMSTGCFNNLYSKIKNRTFENSQAIQIILSLCKQCRIFSDVEKYEDIFKSIKTISTDDISLLNNIAMEKIHRNLIRFQYDKALDLINIIDDTEQLKFSFIKASFFELLNQKDLALTQLKKSMELLNKNKISDNIYASLIGYARLISIKIPDNEIKWISDLEFQDNRFNTRKILNDYGEDIIKERYQENNKELDKYGFQPNSIKSRYTINAGLSSYFLNCYGYICLIDSLGLSGFSDHSQTVVDANKELAPKSNDIFFEWYNILQTKNKSTCDIFFSKDIIYNAGLGQVEEFFDRLYKVLLNLNLLTQGQVSIYLMVMSKLTSVLDQERINNLIRLIIKLDLNSSYHVNIERCLNLIAYSINRESFVKSLDIIVSGGLNKYLFPLYFLDYRYNVNGNKKLKKSEVSKNILDLSKSQDSRDRSDAIAMTMIFEKIISKTNKKKIFNNLYTLKDEFGLPNKNNFFPTIWMKCDEFDDKEAFIRYLKNPKLDRIYQGNGMYVSGGNAYHEVLTYEKVLIELLINDLNGLTLSIEDIKSVLNYFNDYIENEKHCFSNHLFDEEKSIIQTMYIINSIIILLIFSMKYKEGNINYMFKELDRYIDLTSEVRELFGVDLLIENTKDAKIFSNIKKKMFTGNQGNIRASSRLILSYLMFKKDKSVCDVVHEILELLVVADIRTSSKIITSLNYVFSNNFFLHNHDQNRVIEAFKDSIEHCKEHDETKEIFDFLYNISELAFLYYKNLNVNGLSIEKSFNDLIGMLKTNKLNEIKNKWNDLI